MREVDGREKPCGDFLAPIGSECDLGRFHQPRGSQTRIDRQRCRPIQRCNSKVKRPSPFRVCCCGDEVLSTTLVRTHGGCCPVPRAPIRVVAQNVTKRGMSLPSLALAGRLIDSRTKQWMPKTNPLVLDRDEPQSLGRSKRVNRDGCLGDRLSCSQELVQGSCRVDGREQQQRADGRAKVGYLLAESPLETLAQEERRRHMCDVSVKRGRQLEQSERVTFRIFEHQRPDLT